MKTAHIRFEIIEGAKRKLPSWAVKGLNSEEPIGEIVWDFAWRKYVCKPKPGTKWDEYCFRKAAEFMEARTREHRNNQL